MEGVGRIVHGDDWLTPGGWCVECGRQRNATDNHVGDIATTTSSADARTDIWAVAHTSRGKSLRLLQTHLKNSSNKMRIPTLSFPTISLPKVVHKHYTHYLPLF